jgi:glycosyltransferase involved in cell wall biosynthesis
MEAPARILFIIKNLQQGGTEEQLLQTLAKIDRSLFECHVCTITSDVNYHRLPHSLQTSSLCAPDFGPAAIEGLIKVIDDYRPSLIHSFRDRVNLYVWSALKRTRHQPALLVSVRGRPIYPHHLALYRLLSRRAFRITVNSRGVSNILRRIGRVAPARITMIHNLSDSARFRPATERERCAARERLDVHQQSLVLLCPARVAYVKNQLGLVVALGLLRRRGVLPRNTVVLLPGRIRDRLPGALLPHLVRFFGLEETVRIPGPVEDLVPYYAAADAMLLPSWAEGMPNVSLEAHLSGLPILVTRRANADDIVVDGQTGVVVAGASPWRLARGIMRLLAASPPERAAMGAAGRRRVLEHFPSAGSLQKTTQLYLEALRSAAITAPVAPRELTAA